MSRIIERSLSWNKLLQAGVMVGLLSATLVVSAFAWMEIEPGTDPSEGFDPSGVMIVQGEYVMNIGEVQINITNWGLIGSAFSTPSTYSNAPSCQWPAGSGNEYLWASGLWVGGVVLGERLVSTGGRSSEWGPLDEIEYTIYEAVDTKLIRPPNDTASGRRAPMPDSDDDADGLVDEEILNGFDDDDDGLIDEDFGQIGNQMFVLTNFDNTRRVLEVNPEHKPLNLEVVQTTFQWENDQVDDFVGFDYKISNIGVTDINGVYIGFFSDSDIQPRSGGSASDDMAGSYRGIVRASDGTFQFIEVGYMYDAAEDQPLPGYFGIIFLGHDVDASGLRAPTQVGMRTFQSFSGSLPFEQGGDPTNDAERYELMSMEESDDNTALNKQDDFRFLVSAGPFEVLEPDATLNFQVGMVVGPGLGNADGGRGLLANCAEALLTWQGIWIDGITSVQTNSGATINPGQGGRETMLCMEDFGPGGAQNPFNNFNPDFMDTSCLTPEWVLGQPTVSEDDKFLYDSGDGPKTCAMFNMDHCLECVRQLGRICTEVDFDEFGQWDCNDTEIFEHKPGCTGLNGNDTQIHWLVGMAPPPPGLRLWPTDSRVHVFWDNRSETTEDIRLKKIDFESYRVWRADNWDRPFGSSVENGPENGLWQLIGEFDLVNSYVTSRVVDSVVYRDTIPLGANTGLTGVQYDPAILSDPQYDGLAEDTQTVVDGDPEGQYKERPNLRDSNGVLIPDLMPLWPWEAYPDAMDTFWAVSFRDSNTAEDIELKRATQYYEYVDSDIHNGFIYFYSVTATDHELIPGDNPEVNLPVGVGLVGNPGSSFLPTTPGANAQTAEERERDGVNIYLFPNPATRDALEEYQQMSPNGDDPTGVRVTFSNLPMARNTVKIYTVSGDLVQTIAHDGTNGSGHVSWNLMSRNGQEIVSGIYLYSVQSDSDRFDDFVGKFVVVR